MTAQKKFEKCQEQAKWVVTHFEFASDVGAVYDRALFFSSITSSGCYEKSCAVIDRAYSRRKFKVGHYQKEVQCIVQKEVSD